MCVHFLLLRLTYRNVGIHEHFPLLTPSARINMTAKSQHCSMESKETFVLRSAKSTHAQSSELASRVLGANKPLFRTRNTDRSLALFNLGDHLTTHTNFSFSVGTKSSQIHLSPYEARFGLAQQPDSVLREANNNIPKTESVKQS